MEYLEKNKFINIAISLGEDKAKKLFFEEVNQTKKYLKNLNLFPKDFISLVSFLEKRV